MNGDNAPSTIVVKCDVCGITTDVVQGFCDLDWEIRHISVRTKLADKNISGLARLTDTYPTSGHEVVLNVCDRCKRITNKIIAQKCIEAWGKSKEAEEISEMCDYLGDNPTEENKNEQKTS